jgi:hypothetical protein
MMSWVQSFMNLCINVPCTNVVNVNIDLESEIWTLYDVQRFGIRFWNWTCSWKWRYANIWKYVHIWTFWGAGRISSRKMFLMIWKFVKHQCLQVLLNSMYSLLCTLRNTLYWSYVFKASFVSCIIRKNIKFVYYRL